MRAVDQSDTDPEQRRRAGRLIANAHVRAIIPSTTPYNRALSLTEIQQLYKLGTATIRAN